MKFTPIFKLIKCNTPCAAGCGKSTITHCLQRFWTLCWRLHMKPTLYYAIWGEIHCCWKIASGMYFYFLGCWSSHHMSGTHIFHKSIHRTVPSFGVLHTMLMAFLASRSKASYELGSKVGLWVVRVLSLGKHMPGMVWSSHPVLMLSLPI